MFFAQRFIKGSYSRGVDAVIIREKNFYSTSFTGKYSSFPIVRIFNRRKTGYPPLLLKKY